MQMLTWALAFLVIHLARVAFSRFSCYKHIHQRYGSRYALPNDPASSSKPRMIDSYRGVRDAQRISRLFATVDFPFLFTKSLEFALFRSYGIPTISSLLLHTGQLGKAENAARRYVDTATLIQAFTTFPLPRLDLPDGGEAEANNPVPGEDNRELFGEALDDPRSAIALARVNFLHGRWRSKISNDDLLYTLSTFIIEPAKWIDRCEWRKTSELEKEALFALFYHIGRCMGIKRIPETREELIEWSVNYECQHMVFEKCNKEVADHTTNLLLYSLPKVLHGFARNMVSSLMDDRLRHAMGYTVPPSWLVGFKDALLRIRAFVTRYLLLPRRKPLVNIPIANDEEGRVFSIQHLLNEGIPAVCPASGARASDGKTCPVGGHLHAPTPANKEEGGFKPAAWRMELKWYENEPVYSRPYSKGSVRWYAEEVKIVLGLLKREERRGAKKWLPVTLPPPEEVKGKEDKGKGDVVEGLGGFRLEEMGPKGLEVKGRKEVLADAERLFGGKIEGKWAFEP
ncbi:hypothetical protein NDA11_002334 [Ustilago hordei]|uniref:ER-bound oxygenase mpaB/mpaB'/Rubber oxygenase catalytic domain-containing protein n=1 Tax=Ustilago hordei TaxID=120017 RepID=I2G1K3_USTHO|nr:uncharacterized protein UHO2_02484 [Ustilago hordei]KAJ1040150.1 hypothetical protein NDA10_001717 [Ustilago hordei]KAJ1584853.1 hypothetical protein NDA15_000108 [Ustilago hordei]KAJ1588086.1 hypothetical protein NDA12_003647 [Ustilago hordei]KAJ1592840.1 hypothetical protein NDA11_002334 [Ustilago hordei]KAJ1601431.1 hypothetical protein NDA14_002508 [Ustilago hordei]